jgi:hydroxymethylpyrimidine/phosphomethylpyrimidine kinase
VKEVRKGRGKAGTTRDSAPTLDCMQAEHTPRVLSIAGSDSGGGAGIQADLKAFAACGVHGMTAITAITAQNTTGVDAIQPVAPEVIVAQVKAVAGDIGVDAVKIGMLGDTATIAAVVEALDLVPAGTPVVVDPVMVSESGARLLDEAAVEALRNEIVTRATVVTPNLPEARVLADQEADAETLARAIVGRGAQAVVVTGGHAPDATDVFFDGAQLEHIPGERHEDGAAHGSGCTHSSVLAANLALGATPLQAARIARDMAADAVKHGLRDVGAGPGPVDALHIRSRRAAALPLT